MSSGKSPGADGLPVEFYRRFWSLLGQDLIDVLNNSFTHGSLSDTQRQGILRLLFKKNNPLDLKKLAANFLAKNTDHKICTKVLAN